MTEGACTATVVFTGDVSWDGGDCFGTPMVEAASARRWSRQLSTRTQPPNRHERTIVLSL